MSIRRRAPWLLLAGSLTGTLTGTVQAQTTAPTQPSAQAPLVLRGATVIDVRSGQRLSDQQVVIVGNRIQAVTDVRRTKVPSGARVIEAQGKYVIPGLWDMHGHSTTASHALMLAYGVTGMRDAWSAIPLDTMIRWRREILAGRRIGPPRQLLSGVAIDEQDACTRPPNALAGHVCVSSGDSADARRLIASLKQAGADIIKIYGGSPPQQKPFMSSEMYYALAREARRAGLPFGGHRPPSVGVLDASDSGAALLDHTDLNAERLKRYCPAALPETDRCGAMVAQHLRANGAWIVNTAVWGAWMRYKHPEVGWDEPLSAQGRRICEDLEKRMRAIRAGEAVPMGPLGLSRADAAADSRDFMAIVHRTHMPIVAGSDAGWAEHPDDEMLLGPALHAELALYVARGLTPLEALQAATLNPATMLHATDSLGTVEAGKLADLVLLDADPLADITNTIAIRAVVANGRYFDRAALDGLLIRSPGPSGKHP